MKRLQLWSYQIYLIALMSKFVFQEVIVLNIFEYNRMIIVGNNGSGKSFLSKELSVITGLPLVHLDVEFWRPNWEKPPKD